MYASFCEHIICLVCILRTAAHLRSYRLHIVLTKLKSKKKNSQKYPIIANDQ